MRKKTIGEVLRLERRNQGFRLEEVERRTDIQIDYLEAIEADDFDRLPSAFYARSFLKQYAQFLDLDEEIILDAYERGALITYDEIEVLPEDDRRMRRVRKRKTSFLPFFYLGILSLAVVIFISYFLWQEYQGQGQETSPSSISLVTSESSSAAEESTSSQTPASSAAVGNLQIATEGNLILATLSGGGETANLSLSVGETSSWVSVSGTEWADGTTLSPSNPTLTSTLSRGTTTDILIGNTTGLTVSVNDQVIDLSSLVDLSGTIRLEIRE